MAGSLTAHTVSSSAPASPAPVRTFVRALALSAPSIPPGGSVAATGQGCPPGSGVTLTVNDAEVGTATADPSGHFSAALSVNQLPVGNYQVLAHCGPVLAAPMVVVLASSVQGDTSTLTIILLFLLIGAALAYRQMRGN